MANPWDAENFVESNQALEMIKNQFPDLSANKIKFLGSGYDNTVYLINDQYIFRFPRKSISVPLLENEIFILPKIAKFLPYPVTVPKWIGKPQDNYPWIFVGYEKLPGKSACHLNLTDLEREHLAEPLGKFLSKLHSIPVTEDYKEKLPDDSKVKLDKNLIIPKIRKNLQIAESLGLLENKEKPYELLKQMENFPLPKSSCIVHGDLYVRHILIDENYQLSGIIDWGDVHIGDPAVDISIAYSFLPPKAHKKFKDAYGEISEPTWFLARLRAFHYGALLIVYGSEVKDEYLVEAGKKCLGYISQS